MSFGGVGSSTINYHESPFGTGTSRKTLGSSYFPFLLQISRLTELISFEILRIHFSFMHLSSG